MNNTEVVFDNIEQRILSEIEDAHYAIFVSVAWFTNKKLFNALCQYHLHQDESEMDFIKAELEEKMVRNTRRIMYSQAKTGATKEVREKAMEVYQNLQKR